ncbi:MAG: hypothetical protein Kow0013_01650 [Pararhodobacter sp.]
MADRTDMRSGEPCHRLNAARFGIRQDDHPAHARVLSGGIRRHPDQPRPLSADRRHQDKAELPVFAIPLEATPSETTPALADPPVPEPVTIPRRRSGRDRGFGALLVGGRGSTGMRGGISRTRTKRRVAWSSGVFRSSLVRSSRSGAGVCCNAKRRPPKEPPFPFDIGRISR